MHNLIINGYLAPFEIKVPAAQINRDSLRVVAGEYVAKDVTERARVITGDAIDQYRKHLDGEKCLVFCSSVAEAERTAACFRDAGYRAASVDGKMKEIERNKRIRDLGNHTLQLLMSCNILSEGLDVPSVRGMIHLRPTYSRSRWIQDVGRTIRAEPGKIAIILDHAGNTEFHGNPMDVHDFNFTGAERREGGAVSEGGGVINCANCFMPHDAALAQCPYCEHTRPKREMQQYKHVEGELYNEQREDGAEMEGIKTLIGACNDTLDGSLVSELEAIAEKHNLPDAWVLEMCERAVEWAKAPVLH